MSVGGEVTTKDFVSQLGLKENMKVLDIGCGTGGSAFYMARTLVNTASLFFKNLEMLLLAGTGLMFTGLILPPTWSLLPMTTGQRWRQL